MSEYVQPFADDRYAADDPFGNIRQSTGRPHLGSDYPAPAGTPVRSIGHGSVVVNQWSSVLGNLLGVQHVDGTFAGYAHLLEPSPLTVGREVQVGEQGIARVGNTGTASQGNHLHLSLGVTQGAIFGEGFGSTLIDPHAFIQSHSIQGDNAMRTVKNIEAGHPTSGWTALVGEFSWYHHPSQRDERLDSRVWNGSLDGVDPLNNAEFEALRATTQARRAELLRALAGGEVITPEIDYDALAIAIKESGALDLVIAGTARPASAVK